MEGGDEKNILNYVQGERNFVCPVISNVKKDVNNDK